jgi:acyl-ACP thioesterase
MKIRQESSSEFEKDFFKLMNNTVYGKTIEKILKRQDIKFYFERKKALKYVK